MTQIRALIIFTALPVAMSGCVVYHSADRDFFNSNATYGAPATSSQKGVSVDKKCSWTTRALLDTSEVHPSEVKPGWVLSWTVSQAPSELHILAIEQPEDPQALVVTTGAQSSGAALCDVVFSREDSSAGPIDEAKSLTYTKSLVETFSSSNSSAGL